MKSNKEYKSKLAIEVSADEEERCAEEVEGDRHSAFGDERHARHHTILVGHYIAHKFERLNGGCSSSLANHNLLKILL